jgi:Lamin Tail Domain
MVRTLLFCVLAGALTTGCSFGDDRRLNGGGTVDAMIDTPVAQQGEHLLITEIKSTDPEFIEIWNPTNREVDLSHYYLSDYGSYWELPSKPTLPGLTTSDFSVRFPNGAKLATNQVITIATDGTKFDAGFTPLLATYAINEASGPRAFEQRVVPGPMLPTITNSNGGEYIILFYWDGVSDLVKDVDIILAGKSAASANLLTTKMPIDGPDPDLSATPYKADNGLFGGGMTMDADATHSFKRRKLETGAETQAGTGNGITGDDETSELLKSTWDGDAADPPSAPTPGVAPTI